LSRKSKETYDVTKNTQIARPRVLTDYELNSVAGGATTRSGTGALLGDARGLSPYLDAVIDGAEHTYPTTYHSTSTVPG
jgi:hypothetical protein